jgi:hypothetical protein
MLNKIKFIIVAQIIPFTFPLLFQRIKEKLPFIKERLELSMLRSSFVITRGILKEYRKYSIFKSKFNNILNDLDEEIDSLEIVLNNWDKLNFITQEIQNGKLG